jgi:endonuclease/exonuclease/phosphatase family metal-dependent hydrolase
MAKLGIYKYFSFMFLVITLLISIFTLFGLFGGSANPVHETAMAMIVYVLPLLLIGNVVMLVYWLVRLRWRWAIIPTITLLCCIPYIGTIFRIGLFNPEETDEPGLKIATYNVALFGREMTGFKAEDILSEMLKERVDILCIQEFMPNSGNKNNIAKYKKRFGHMAKGHDDMMVFSRYPIKATGDIDFGPRTNDSGMWADISVQGQTFRVFNVHLETTGINRTFYQAAKQEMKGHHVEENALVRAVYDNYTLGMVNRAVQANIVAREMRESPYPIILCGDFNDVPYSYVYNLMKGDLVDGFKECGSGFMYTMRGKKKIRIDYIFHDKSLTGEKYYRGDINYSDHYPVFMKIAL